MIGAVPRRVSSPIFVGRVTERAALTEALERAAAGRPGIVLISGEAGVGKTRLLTEATKLADAMGATTVAGVCVDVAAGTLSYAPFVDIVRDLHRAGLTASLLRSTRAELGRLVPEIAPHPDAEPGADARPGDEGGQGRLFAAVRDGLSVASSSTPILVAIEDLHWADASTLDLVKYLARSMQGERYVLLMTARVDTLPRRHPLLAMVADLGSLPWLERIDLPRFDEGELVQQLTGILGRAPDPAIAHDVFERSDGNAFFAEELVATGAVGDGTLPVSLREVLAARLAALDETTQAVVRVAAVAGRVVSHELLERVAGVPSPLLISSLREAVEQRVLVHVIDPTPGYAFRHALAREAAEAELLATERASIHRAIADALEADHALSTGGELARTGEIAYHAMAAQDLSRALGASLAAVAAADQVSAHAEAEVHLNRIVELWSRIPDAAVRVGMDLAGLLARTAHAAASAGHQARAAELARSALTELGATESDRQITILFELFDYAWEAADIAEADRVVAEVMSLLANERSARSAPAFAAASLVRWHHGRYTDAREAAIQAIDVARTAGTPSELARALTNFAQVCTHLGETNKAEAAFAEAGTILDETIDPDVRARSTRWRSWGRYMHGDFEGSLESSRRGLEVARRDGSDGRYGLDLLDSAFESLIELGRFSEARATGNEILARMSTALEMNGFYMSLARLAVLEGRMADAEVQIAHAATIPAVGPHRLWQLEDQVLLAYATGRPADGRDMMDEALSVSSEPDRDAILWWPLRKAIAGEADRAEAARRRRRTAELTEALAAGRRYADVLKRSTTAAIEADGPSPLVVAELIGAEAEENRLEGQPDAAGWAAAIEARRALKQPWELAYAQFRQAEAALASGGPATDAAIPLRDAHETATGLGAAPLVTAIEELASRARIDLGVQASGDGPDPTPSARTLTARELEVLALVAAGHTNREIGDRLFISEKTASVHVTHAMDKLGALSRYEAAAAATRLGLLEPAEVP
jgi:DNA-binding CsgD family transcriptional regulator